MDDLKPAWYHADTPDTSKFKCNSNAISRQIIKLKTIRSGFPQMEIFPTMDLASARPYLQKFMITKCTFQPHYLSKPPRR